MADRKVTFTLGTAVDPQAKREAAELAAMLASIKTAAEGATKAVRATFDASSRGPRSAGAGSGGSGGAPGGRRSPTASGGFERGYDRAAMDDLRRQRADERREREAILADRRREAQAEKKILDDRVKANVEASRRIREAARETKAGHYTTRQSDELKRQQDERVQRNRMQADTAARVRESVEASRAAREAARETKAGNYRARADGTYGEGYGRGGGGSSIPSDGDFKSHIEGVAKAYAAQEQAANRAAAAHQKNVRELVSGSKQAAAGVGSIARAFVYLGVSGEQNIEKALRVLAKFEAGMSAVSGVSDLVGGLSKAAKAYGKLGRGSKLAAGVGAVGAGSTVALGAAALSVGAGVGFGIGRLAIGEHSFGRMTDAWGVTDWAGEKAAANRGRVATTANRQVRQRDRTAERYSDYSTLAGFDIADAEGRGGLGAGSNRARAAVSEARARTASFENRVATGGGGSFEQITGERVAAVQGELTALNAAKSIDERRLQIVTQTVQAEKEKTRAVMEGIEASKASLGLADAATVRLAESGAGKRARGEKLSREEAGALGQFFGDAGQEEAAKLGADVLKSNPELAKLADEIAKTRAANEKAVLVKVEEQVTGQIVVTPNAEKLKADLEYIVKDINEQIRQALKREFEATRKDRESRDDLTRATSGA